VVSSAAILHADLDAFYASVEQRDNRHLRGRPVIVGSGVVLAASYEARAYGVRSAMNGRQARELCPNAIVVSPRMDVYQEASAAVFALFDDITPLVEPISIDEAFLDVSGARNLLGSPAVIATNLRARTRAEVGLAISVGVGRTKFLAKVASAQSKPDGLIVVEPNREQEFLHPLPVTVLWGVGAITAQKLADRGIETVADLAGSGRAELASILGPHAGGHLQALAHNQDPRRVTTSRRDRSMGAQRALGNRVRTRDELRREILALTEKVAARVRKADRVCRTVTVRYRTSEMRHESRSRTLVEPTDNTAILTSTADELLVGLIDGPHGPGGHLGRVGCTLVGITFSGLGRPDAVQLALRFPDQGRATDHLDTLVDDIRGRWGNGAVARASLLNRGQGVPTPPRPTALDRD